MLGSSYRIQAKTFGLFIALQIKNIRALKFHHIQGLQIIKKDFLK